MRTFGGFAALLALFLIQPRAYAQALAEPTAKAAPVTKSAGGVNRQEDLVVLKNGTRYRGVIIESVPDDHLLIEIADDLVRDVAMQDVKYAGPVSGAPVIASAGTQVGTQAGTQLTTSDASSNVKVLAQPGETWLHLQTSSPGLTVWVSRLRSPTDPSEGVGYTQFCEAPCSRPIPLGSYRLAYSRGGSSLIKLGSRIHIQREVSLQVDFKSRTTTRVFGWVVLGLGAAAGVTLLSAAAVLPRGDERRPTDAGLGAASLAAGLAIGLPLGLLSDSAVVVALPGPAVATNNASPPWGGVPRAFTGLSLVGRF